MLHLPKTIAISLCLILCLSYVGNAQTISLFYKGQSLDLNNPIPIGMMKDLSINCSDTTILIQTLVVNHFQNGALAMTQKIENEKITKLDLQSFNFKTADAVNIKVEKAVKIDIKTGEKKTYVYKPRFIAFSIK